ncbi:GNAT family N-acetyltransferase [Sphingobacterium sp. 2149]
MLWVHHDYRNKGLGYKLLKHIENIAEKTLQIITIIVQNH